MFEEKKTFTAFGAGGLRNTTLQPSVSTHLQQFYQNHYEGWKASQ
jgi:hypothetical protein